MALAPPARALRLTHRELRVALQVLRGTPVSDLPLLPMPQQGDAGTGGSDSSAIPPAAPAAPATPPASQ